VLATRYVFKHAIQSNQIGQKTEQKLTHIQPVDLSRSHKAAPMPEQTGSGKVNHVYPGLPCEDPRHRAKDKPVTFDPKKTEGK
jgi:hypothetical protein